MSATEQDFWRRNRVFISFCLGIVLIIGGGLSGWVPLWGRWLGILVVMCSVLIVAGVDRTERDIQAENGRVHQVGRWDGIFIDSRNKISLSRFQIILWTLLALSAWTALVLQRTIPVALNAVPQMATQDTQPLTNTLQSLLKANNITLTDAQAASLYQLLTQDASVPTGTLPKFEPLNVSFPNELLLAMGISTTSLALSAIIKSNKAQTESGSTLKQLSQDKDDAQRKLDDAKKSLDDLNVRLATVSKEQKAAESARAARAQKAAADAAAAASKAAKDTAAQAAEEALGLANSKKAATANAADRAQAAADAAAAPDKPALEAAARDARAAADQAAADAQAAAGRNEAAAWEAQTAAAAAAAANQNKAAIDNEIATANQAAESQLNQAKDDVDQQAIVVAAAQAKYDDLVKSDNDRMGLLHVNDSIQDARWSDMVSGEKIQDYQYVDIAKVQMFFITILVVFSYGALIWAEMTSSGAQVLLGALPQISLPAFSASLVALLGISHAGYLTTKTTGQ